MPLNARDCDWIVDQLHWDRLDVGTFVPEGFEQYVRIFHPAHGYLKNGDVTPVRWSDIASANGRSIFEEMRRFTEYDTYTEADRDLWHGGVGDSLDHLRLQACLQYRCYPPCLNIGVERRQSGLRSKPISKVELLLCNLLYRCTCPGLVFGGWRYNFLC